MQELGYKSLRSTSFESEGAHSGGKLCLLFVCACVFILDHEGGQEVVMSNISMI